MPADDLEIDEPTPAQIFAIRIREVRKALEVSLRGLSQRLADIGYKLDHKAIDKLERGTRTASIEDLLAIAAALNCPPIDLLTPVNRVDPATTDPETGMQKVLAQRVRLTPGITTGERAQHREPLITYVGTLRTWLTRGFPLRSEVDARDEFFGHGPLDEEMAMRATPQEHETRTVRELKVGIERDESGMRTNQPPLPAPIWHANTCT